MQYFLVAVLAQMKHERFATSMASSGLNNEGYNDGDDDDDDDDDYDLNGVGAGVGRSNRQKSSKTVNAVSGGMGGGIDSDCSGSVRSNNEQTRWATPIPPLPQLVHQRREAATPQRYDTNSNTEHSSSKTVNDCNIKNTTSVPRIIVNQSVDTDAVDANVLDYSEENHHMVYHGDISNSRISSSMEDIDPYPDPAVAFPPLVMYSHRDIRRPDVQHGLCNAGAVTIRDAQRTESSVNISADTGTGNDLEKKTIAKPIPPLLDARPILQSHHNLHSNHNQHHHHNHHRHKFREDVEREEDIIFQTVDVSEQI